MSDLHGWITQQVDEAEQRANHAHSPKCIGRAATWTPRGMCRAPDCGCGGPAAALRRCEADRKILTQHQPQPDGTGFPDSLQCRTCSNDGGDGYQYLVAAPCPTLRALAEAYGREESADG